MSTLKLSVIARSKSESGLGISDVSRRVGGQGRVIVTVEGAESGRLYVLLGRAAC